jgi:hypothetical protein
MYFKESQELLCGVSRDDFVAHDNLLQLLPQYWRHVPKSYEYIALGQIPRAFGVAEQLVTGTA